MSHKGPALQRRGEHLRLLGFSVSGTTQHSPRGVWMLSPGISSRVPRAVAGIELFPGSVGCADALSGAPVPCRWTPGALAVCAWYNEAVRKSVFESLRDV